MSGNQRLEQTRAADVEKLSNILVYNILIPLKTHFKRLRI